MIGVSEARVSQGLSPLARGNHLGIETRIVCYGPIPAGAGEPY